MQVQSASCSATALSTGLGTTPVMHLQKPVGARRGSRSAATAQPTGCLPPQPCTCHSAASSRGTATPRPRCAVAHSNLVLWRGSGHWSAASGTQHQHRNGSEEPLALHRCSLASSLILPACVPWVVQPDQFRCSTACLPNVTTLPPGLSTCCRTHSQGYLVTVLQAHLTRLPDAWSPEQGPSAPWAFSVRTIPLRRLRLTKRCLRLT